MYKGLILSLTAVLALLTTNAFAADSLPASSTLRAMGLSGLQVLSDAEASVVRGKGYVHHGRRMSLASVWGNSYANIGGRNAGAGARNGYKASGRRVAEGNTASMVRATLAKTWRRGHGHGQRAHVRRQVVTKTFISGGSSFARAR